MKLVLDCSDKELQRITMPALRPGQAVIATANGDLYRLTKPLITLEDGHILARIASHRPITGPLVAESVLPLRIASPVPAAASVTVRNIEQPAAWPRTSFSLEDTAAFQAFRQSEVKRERETKIPAETKIDVPPELRARIIEEAEKQKAKYNGRVYRTKIRDVLNLDNDMGYKMVKQICDEMGYWFATPAEYSAEEWTHLLESAGHRCQRPGCGSQDNLTADHVIPLSKGGSRGMSNLQVLCRSCNSSKGDKIIDYR